MTPLTISARNAVTMTGMSWRWCLRFAEANDVTIYRITDRKRLIDGPQLMAAIARASAAQQPVCEVSDAEIADQMRARLRVVGGAR